MAGDPRGNLNSERNMIRNKGRENFEEFLSYRGSRSDFLHVKFSESQDIGESIDASIFPRHKS